MGGGGREGGGRDIIYYCSSGVLFCIIIKPSLQKRPKRGVGIRYCEGTELLFAGEAVLNSTNKAFILCHLKSLVTPLERVKAFHINIAWQRVPQVWNLVGWKVLGGVDPGKRYSELSESLISS